MGMRVVVKKKQIGGSTLFDEVICGAPLSRKVRTEKGPKDASRCDVYNYEIRIGIIERGQLPALST
jgi:hypothetical protein